MDNKQSVTFVLGSIIRDVLTCESHHRSTEIWRGAGDYRPLQIRRHDGEIWRGVPFDPRVQRYIDKTDFGGAVCTDQIKLNHSLVTALVEHW